MQSADNSKLGTDSAWQPLGMQRKWGQRSRSQGY